MNMELIAISDPGFISNELSLLNQLFEAGLPLLHLRKEGLNSAGYAQIIKGIAPVFHPRLVLHQFHELISEFDIHRLHYPEKMRSQMNHFSAKHINSTSVHQLEDLPTLNGFSYAFLSPVFDSISKMGYKSVLPDDFYIQSEIKKTPVIGLGGISTGNLERVREMNFDGAAVLGSLWKEPENVIAKFREIRDVVYLMNRFGNHDEP